MDLVLILGPMKSGKSFELISYFAPLQFSRVKFSVYQPDKNIRDEEVWSRNGITITANKIMSLKEITNDPAKVIGIDEIHMFPENDVDAVAELLEKGKEVVVSGLDLDHQGRLMPIVRRLLELGPKEVRHKRAVCEKCKSLGAVYTQVYKGKKPVPGDLPSCLPEDGTYRYVPVCRKCFIKK